MDSPSETISIKEATALLDGVSEGTVAGWLRSGTWEAQKIKGRWAINRKDFEQWCNKNSYRNQSTDTPSKWLNPGEVSEIFQVDYGTVSKWLRDGVFPGYKFGGTWRIDRKDFEQWLEEQSNGYYPETSKKKSYLESEWLTPEQISRNLSIRSYVVKRWFKNKKIPGYKIVKAWRIHAEDFERWCSEQSNTKI